MNNNYLAAFVDELYRLGLREVVVSPGSRSTALALLFEEYGKFSTYVDIDERSAGFFALGIAKVTERPVVLLCTSGSAGAHYFPALVEAKQSRIPLLVLTADRPAELQFVGAPQTIVQTRLFGNFVNHFEELSVPSQTDFWTYPRQVAQRAYLASVDGPAAAVQINVPLREPLLPDLQAENFAKGRAAQAFRTIRGQMSATFPSENLPDKILILAGPDSFSDYQEALLSLSERLQAPILADPLSNLRNFSHENLIDSYDAFLSDAALKTALKPDLIFQFGQMPVSKRVQQFVKQFPDIDYVQVDPALAARNPSQTTTTVVQSSVKAFAEQLNSVKFDRNYLSLWQKAQRCMRQILDSVSTENENFEGHYVQVLQNLLPAGSQLVVSNSMEIRDVDYFWRQQKAQVKLFGNRGANGIDGTESTALGIATSGQPTVLLTGDLSFLHDLNGLILAKTHALNLTIVLFNNDGGGIFHHLAQNGQPHFDYLFSTPHGLDFSALSNLTGLDYQAVKSYDDFERIFRQSVKSPGLHLLEIKTDKARSVELHKKYTTYHEI